ncbi:MAG: triose-phosphate isomerase [Bacteroidales bacterium]|nr:triose-phosphate isomerase [Bacteroidales bacterium]
MRKKIVAGNWKMNTDLNSGLELAKAVSEKVKSIDLDTNKFGLIIATPFTHLYAVSQVIDSSKVQLSAQNIADNEKGAFTGETSASMIKSVGATATLLGHSERRAFYGETSETLTKKLKIALDHNLLPIFCIGEVLEEREAEKHFEVVKSQIDEVLFNLDVDDFKKVIIAYEPVWAIGTGKVASPEQAQEIHAFIRKIVSEKFGAEVAENTTILYGGSCSPSNAAGLFSQPDIDGGLIGGASLKPDDFIELLKIRMQE